MSHSLLVSSLAELYSSFYCSQSSCDVILCVLFLGWITSVLINARVGGPATAAQVNVCAPHLGLGMPVRLRCASTTALIMASVMCRQEDASATRAMKVSLVLQ